ncbi:MAG: hypothetical protein ACP5JH_05030 [Bacteroidota bacterium]
MKSKSKALGLVLAFLLSFAYTALNSSPIYGAKPSICQGNATPCADETICWWVDGELHCYTVIYFWMYNT